MGTCRRPPGWRADQECAIIPNLVGFGAPAGREGMSFKSVRKGLRLPSFGWARKCLIPEEAVAYNGPMSTSPLRLWPIDALLSVPTLLRDPQAFYDAVQSDDGVPNRAAQLAFSSMCLYLSNRS